MALQKKAIGAIVYFKDDANKLLFTHAEVTKARDRYAKELAKKLVNSQ